MPKLLRVSKENNAYQYAETLKRNRIKRQRCGEFFVEGVKPIEQAIKFGWDISSFYYTKQKPLSNWAKNILKNSRAEKHFDLSLDIHAKLSDKEDPSELMAIVKIPENDLSRINTNKDFLVIVFDRPSNPGNLGSVIRSCDAYKANGMIITGHGVDLYDPQTIRSSIGTLFSLPVISLSSHKELLSWIDKIKGKTGEIQIIGSSAKADKNIYQQDFTKPTLLIIGNETFGISKAYKELSNELVKIPIYGSASSLNVACATSIMLYEIYKQRKAV